MRTNILHFISAIGFYLTQQHHAPALFDKYKGQKSLTYFHHF